MIAKKKEKQLKQRLEEEKRQILDRIKGMNEGGLHQSMRDSTGELSLYDNHPGDVASEVFERSKDLALRGNAYAVVRAIDDALEKMDRGTYGRCDICKNEIPAERLQAVPYTTLCLNCKKDDERVSGTENRPAEEEVMADVYARPFDKEEENVGFDWVDTYHQVARWNEHAEDADSGSYYGTGDLDGEDDPRGSTEDVDGIPYKKVEDGIFYNA